jgi:type IV pilus assembly protein PilV
MLILKTKQSGVALIEALVGILIFSIGIIGLMGLQAASIKNSADAKYRADAAFRANQIIGQMWADNPANLSTYAHRPSGTACAPTGTNSTNANVTAWLSSMSDPSSFLPGATSAKQQIIVDTTNNRVTVTVCWQGPQETTPHNYVAIAQING